MRSRYSLITVVTLFVFVMLSVSSYAINPENIAAMWLFDEDSGDTAKDSSGQANHGTLMEDPKWVDGQFGKALEFDGDNDYVNMGDVLDQDGSSAFSISAWIKAANGVNEQIIVSKMSSGGSHTGYSLRASDTSPFLNFSLISDVSPDNRIQIRGSTEVNDGTWHHVVATYDGTKSASGVHLYVDGQEETKAVRNDTLTGSTSNSIDFNIGERESGAGAIALDQFFTGLIDEVAIFNVVLDDADIEDIMTKGLATAVAVFPAGRTAATWGSVKRQLAK